MKTTFTAALLLLGIFFVSCSSSQLGRDAQLLRVMTFNIHHGEGLDGKVDIKRIARLIMDSQADIVALQEVDRGVERSGRRDIMTELSDFTGMTYAFGKNIDFQGGWYGNGFLTRYPILEERNYHYKMIRSGEQRGALVMVLDVRGREVIVLNTHLDYREDDAERTRNTEEIAAILRSHGNRPAIVCGDFNDLPGSRTLSSLQAVLLDSWEEAGQGDGFTYPSIAPIKRIDYVLVTRPAERATTLAPRSARVLATEASDHRPLLVELELRGN